MNKLVAFVGALIVPGSFVVLGAGLAVCYLRQCRDRSLPAEGSAIRAAREIWW